MIRLRPLFAAMLQRELDRRWTVAAIVVAAVVVRIAFAAVAHGPVDGPGLAARLLQRADLALLAVCAFLAALRVSQRIADDHAGRWIDPWIAAGGDPRGPVLAVIVAVTVATWLWFAVGATAFALGVVWAAHTGELLRRLPLLLAGGSLVIAGTAAYTAVFAALTKEAVSAVLAAGILAIAPFVVLMLHIESASGAELPLLVRWAGIHAPPVAPAATPAGFMIQAVYAGITCAIAAAVAMRTAGRRS